MKLLTGLWSFQGETGRESAFKLICVTDFSGPLQRLSEYPHERAVGESAREDPRWKPQSLSAKRRSDIPSLLSYSVN